MDDRGRYNAVSRLHMHMARLVQFVFPHVHMLLERHGGSRDPETIRVYHDRKESMRRDLDEFEKLLTLETDDLIAPAAGTSRGQWCVELLMHVGAAANSLGSAWHPGSLKGEGGREVLANPGDERLTWSEHPHLEESYQAAVEFIGQETARVACLLRVLRNSRVPATSEVSQEDELEADDESEADPVDGSIGDSDEAILKYLLERRPVRCYVADIAAGTDPRLSARTVGPRLRRLIELELAERSEGDKGGATITKKGADWLALPTRDRQRTKTIAT